MKIAFLGDVMLGRLVNNILKTESPGYPWGDTLSILKKVDIRICNLECVISDCGSPWSATPKIFHFRSDAKNIASLKAANINAVSLANNHVLDFGEDALLDTLEILQNNGIYYAGTGKNIHQASYPAILKFNKKTIGIISFTDNEPVWEAEKNKPGTFYVPINETDKRALRLFDIIRETRKKVELLIVSAHWGPNWGYRPLPEHVDFAHRFIENGVDIVYSHSPHVFRGIEIYERKPILYSTGNFVDDYAVDETERNDQSFIFVIKIDSNKIMSLELFPTIITNFQANLAVEEESHEIVPKMQNLCDYFGTNTNWHPNRKYLEIKP